MGWTTQNPPATLDRRERATSPRHPSTSIAQAPPPTNSPWVALCPLPCRPLRGANRPLVEPTRNQEPAGEESSAVQTAGELRTGLGGTGSTRYHGVASGRIVDLYWNPSRRHAAPVCSPGAFGAGITRDHYHQGRRSPRTTSAATCQVARDRSRGGATAGCAGHWGYVRRRLRHGVGRASQCLSRSKGS